MSWFNLFANLARARDDMTYRRTTNAMSPINWLAGTIVTGCFGTICYLPKDDPLRPFVFCVGAVMVLVAGGIAVYFALWRPDRLQTEDHLTQLRALDLLVAKGGKIPINPVNLPAIANPYAPSHEHEHEGGDSDGT